MVAEAQLSWADYATAWSDLHGGVDPRASSRLVRTWLRFGYQAGRALRAARVPAGAVTAFGLLAAVAMPVVAVFHGYWIFVAGVLVFLSALADSADGAVALMARRTTALGAVYDSLADRVSEAAWLLGLYLLGADGRLVVACGALAWLHEYARARAAAVGMKGIAAVTVAERPTRIIMVIAACLLGGIAWYINPYLVPGTVTVTLGFWAVLGILGGLKLLTAIRTSL